VCGSAASRLADPVGCAQGWVRLDDVRYEARDIQQLSGLLADAGVVDGQKVGVTGGRARATPCSGRRRSSPT
jgi:hypothetical protein